MGARWGLAFALVAAIVASVGCGPVGLGSTAKRPPPDVPLALEAFSLPNGLEVIVSPDRSRDAVGLDMTYRVGWLDDPPNRPGLAHLVEHLMFTDLGHLPDGYDAYMRSLGASGANGSTGATETHYHVVVPTGGLEGALWVERERMTSSFASLAPERVAAEVRILEDEARLRGDLDPQRSVTRTLLRLVEHGDGALAPPEQLRGVDAARDIAPFQARAYAPNRATLVVTGNVGPTLRAQLTRLLGDIPAIGPAPSRAREEPRVLEGRRETMRTTGRRPIVGIAWGVPPSTSPEGLATRTALGIAARTITTSGASFDRFGAAELSFYDTGLGAVAVLTVEGKPGASAATLEGDVLDVVDDEVVVTSSMAQDASVAAQNSLLAAMDRMGPRARTLALLRAEQGASPSLELALASRTISQADVVDALQRRVRAKRHRAILRVVPEAKAGAGP